MDPRADSTPSSDGDEVLVRRAIAGDEAAIERLTLRLGCIPRLLAGINARRGTPLGAEDLADLAQDTFMRIWKKLEAFDGSSRIEAWAFGFCHLEHSNRLRRTWTRQRESGSAEIRLSDLADEPVPDVYDHLELGLQAVGPPAEEIIRLKHFEHLMFLEISARLGIPESTVKSRYYRGLARLKQHLERGER